MVESSVFIFYNFFQIYYNHGLFAISLIFAIIYLLLNIIGLTYTIITPLTFDHYT